MTFQGFARPTTTDTPDEFFDVILPKVTGLAELKVILYVIRHTFGYNKWLDRISLSEFERGIVTRQPNGQEKRIDFGVGLSRPAIVSGLREAVAHEYLRKHIVCPSCYSEVIPVPVARPYKSRTSSGTVRILDVPALCPSCQHPLKGREQIYYGLRWRDGEEPAVTPRDVMSKYRGLWRQDIETTNDPSKELLLGGSKESFLPLVKNVNSQQLTPSVLTPADAGVPARGPLAPDSVPTSDAPDTGAERSAHTAGPSGNDRPQRDEPAACASDESPARDVERGPGWDRNEPLPVRRERVLRDLREHAHDRRTQIYIVAVNVGQMMGLRWVEGQLRTHPTKEDKAEVGKMCREYGGPAHVWTVACRIAGHEIAGDPLDYLWGRLKAEKEGHSDGGAPTRATGEDYVRDLVAGGILSAEQAEQQYGVQVKARRSRT